MQTINRKLTFPALFAETLQKFPNRGAYSFVDETPITYRQAHQRILAVMAFLEKLQTKPGDKIAILSHNMPNWGISYFATTFMGAISVPLLPDFHPFEIDKYVEHAGATILFVSKNLEYKIQDIEFLMPPTIICIDDFSIVKSKVRNVKFDAQAVPAKEYAVQEHDLAAINYTSGTTGTPKGVMLSHKNIAFTAIQALEIHHVDEHDRIFSILPIAHSLENTLGLVLPMIFGCCIFYLKKPPTVDILLQAMKSVKPTAMISVPMIIEKVYHDNFIPYISRSWLRRTLYGMPSMRRRINYMFGLQLKKKFGGHLRFFGVGGSSLDMTVERFLMEARFPYTVGYGLTETAPLLASAAPFHTKFRSTGKVIQGIELKISNPDPNTGEGEIVVKGDNVMQGYYNEPKLTKTVFDKDGWLKTGDLGVLDKDNYLFFKGRLKNMISLKNGKNVYPEEIETVINSFHYVDESLVVEQKGKLVALVRFNEKEIADNYVALRSESSDYVEKRVDELKLELEEYINERVSTFARIQSIISQKEPFKKTATLQIKRFLYTENG